MKQRVWAIVPAKSLARGKSRLSPVLADEDRVHFARQLLEHVLGVVRDCRLDGVLIATDGDDVAKIAASGGAFVLRDQSGESLAALVDRALADVAGRGALAAVVLMADLPRLEPRDVEALLDALVDRDIVLVRDHAGRHTNALAISPPTAIRTCFGSDQSFADHRAAAGAAGLRVAVLDNDRIAFDVDGPADLYAFTRSPPGAET
ncbi:MAG: 2-phospho-L-lactate guanylyltransferase [Myxococcota bacterium]|nr:2-phospho-L-lactate guanylyltransferase [Myxococcota bacterium]